MGIGVKIELEESSIERIIEQVVERVLRGQTTNRMIPESEAAKMLGLTHESIQGERRKKRIVALVGPGRKIYYTPEAMKEYIQTRQIWDGR